MLNSGGAVRASELTDVAGGVRARLVTRGAGRFVAYCSPAPTRVLIDGGDGEPLALPFVWAEEDGLGQLTLTLPCLDHGFDANVIVHLLSSKMSIVSFARSMQCVNVTKHSAAPQRA